MAYIFEKAVADLTKVPAPFQPFYTVKNDDGTMGMPDDLFNHLDTAGLRSALEKERKAAGDREKALKPWTELGEAPDVVRQKIQTLTEELAKKDTTTGQFEKFKEEITKAHSTALSAKDEEILRMKSTLESYLVESEATRILADAHGSPALLMPHIKGCVKVVEENGKHAVRVVDAEGDPRYNTSGAYMTISDLVNELKAHTEYGKAFEPSGTNGSGMRPGGPTQKPRTADPSTLSANDKIRLGLEQSTRR